jgi:hypothetical protein
MKKVLILSPNLDQALAIARFLRRYGKEWILHGGLLEGEKIRGTATKYYDKIVNVRAPKDFGVYDCILPTGARSTYWVVTQIGDFYVGEVLYSRNNILCFDKYNFIHGVAALGVPVPKTYKNFEDVNIEYPIFYKSKFEKGGGARGIIFSRKDLEKIPSKNELIFQEYIPGRTTYGIGFIAKNGDILTFFQHEELLSLPIEGGSAIYLKRFNDEKLLSYTQRIIQNLRFSGWGLAEFKYCYKRRDYVFMEVNAKLWASIEFSLLNNNNFLKYMFNISYPETPTDSALYIERLIALGLPECIQNIHYLLESDKIIRYSSLKELPIIFVRNGILFMIKKLIKNYRFKRTYWQT